MRRLLLFLAILLVASPVHAALWYVRVNGSTATNCTGHTNADYDGSGTGEACAYSSVNTAVNAMAAGDTLTIMSGTYNETVHRAASLSSISADTIIQGDPANVDTGGFDIRDPYAGGTMGADAVTIDGGGIGNVMQFDGVVQRVKFKNFRLTGGNSFLIAIILSNTNSRDNLYYKLHLDDHVGTMDQICAGSGCDSDAAMLFSPFGGGGSSYRSEVSNCWFEGDSTDDANGYGRDQVCARIKNVAAEPQYVSGATYFIDPVDCVGPNWSLQNSPLIGSIGSSIVFGGNAGMGALTPVPDGFWIHDNYMNNWLGWTLGQGKSNSIFENNVVTDNWGYGDDGGIQFYDDTNSIIRYNLFLNMCPTNFINHGYINVRSTRESENPARCKPVNPDASYKSSLEVVNNTFVMISSATCTTSISNRCLIFRGTQCEYNTTPASTAFINNLIVGTYGNSVSNFGAIKVDIVNNTPICPTAGDTIRVDHNLFEQTITQDERVPAIYPATCTNWSPQPNPAVYTGTYDYQGVGDLYGSAGLNASYAPALSSSIACLAGASYVMEDGTTSADWIGALQGACTGGAVQNPQTSPLLGGTARGVKFQ